MTTRRYVLCVLGVLAAGPACARWGDLVTRVTVRAPANCVKADYRSVAQAIPVQPGEYCVTIRKGRGVIFGARAVYGQRRPVGAILRMDPHAVTRTGSFPSRPVSAVALFSPGGHFDTASCSLLVKKPTTVYAFLVDHDASDNAGGVRVCLYRGPHWPDEGVPPLKAVWLDGKSNCLSTDLRRVAVPVTLKPGSYHFRCGGGGIAYGTGKDASVRASQSVLVDLDPAAAGFEDSCGAPATSDYPISALSLGGSGTDGWSIKVRRTTRIYAYVIAAPGEPVTGSVTFEVREGALKP